MTRCRLCERNASYSIKGDKGGKFCSIHKTDEMINVVSKRCEYSNCESLNNNFDFKNGNGRFCKLHKMAEMIDVVSKRCEYNDCVIRATFDIKDGKGKFCKKHKTLEMVDVKHIHCIEDQCKSRAYFGIPGSAHSHCTKHRQSGMIRQSKSKCKIHNCKNNAIYGINNIPIHCVIHKTEEMNDVKHKKCNQDSCNKIPSYNYIVIQTAKYCKNHKLELFIKN
jgi:hypothetical protein